MDQALLEDEPLAVEVSAIEFLYFDGFEWLDSWDSDQQGGLPPAVQISLALTPEKMPEEDNLAWSAVDFQQLVDDGRYPIYRLVVPLQGAQGGSSSEDEYSDDSFGDMGELF